MLLFFHFSLSLLFFSLTYFTLHSSSATSSKSAMHEHSSTETPPRISYSSYQNFPDRQSQPRVPSPRPVKHTASHQKPMCTNKDTLSTTVPSWMQRRSSAPLVSVPSPINKNKKKRRSNNPNITLSHIQSQALRNNRARHSSGDLSPLDLELGVFGTHRRLVSCGERKSFFELQDE